VRQVVRLRQRSALSCGKWMMKTLLTLCTLRLVTPKCLNLGPSLKPKSRSIGHDGKRRSMPNSRVSLTHIPGMLYLTHRKEPTLSTANGSSKSRRMLQVKLINTRPGLLLMASLKYTGSITTKPMPRHPFSIIMTHSCHSCST
jgi:hypothetical protein